MGSYITLFTGIILCCKILVVVNCEDTPQSGSQNAKETKPNIIIILADDMVNWIVAKKIQTNSNH